ncbi:hypothetical protein L3X38_037991 [Prunus dulcis]|uniref:Integrase zinc-binding domain-containing protein n=1 Tax=Prunus dulcis TaxID=3755 RepID=A0AAD4V5J1_PRUDU|nr:hypothetical protein L3X38_037991 [Prunus dulcis]
MNGQADSLAHTASTSVEDMRVAPVELLSNPSIPIDPGVMQIDSEEKTWMTPIMNYLTKGIQPDDSIEARKLQIKAARYAIIEDTLFSKSFLGPYLRCLDPREAEWVLNEIHQGTCGNHTGERSLAHKALTQGYFWPYMARDAEQFSRKCYKCQRHAPLIRQLAEELNPVVGPWPFARWGMDIVGPLPTAVGGKKFIILATDYFTKWGEAEAYKMVTQTDVIRFRKLEQRKAKWSEELLNVLWAYRITKRKPTGKNPFSLAYGTEAVIPTEIGLPTVRTLVVESNDNEQQLAHKLDMLEEQREAAALQLENYQNQAANYFNKRV